MKAVRSVAERPFSLILLNNSIYAKGFNLPLNIISVDPTIFTGIVTHFCILNPSIMYTPNQYKMNEHGNIISFMKAYSFATIITVADNIPTATHLPFVVNEAESGIILSAHFAKANTQWHQLTNGNKVLVIFGEPHAYISPKHYDS